MTHEIIMDFQFQLGTELKTITFDRDGEAYRAQIGDLGLRVGDAIVLHGTWTPGRKIQDQKLDRLQYHKEMSGQPIR